MSHQEIEPSFGAWVRRRRRLLDKTRQALADEIGCSVSTLQKIEGDTRRPSREMAARLAEFLDIPESDRVRFIQVARGVRMTANLGSLTAAPLPGPFEGADALQTAPAAGFKVPVLSAPDTPNTDRDTELAAILQQLQDTNNRLLTFLESREAGQIRPALETPVGTRLDSKPVVVWVSLAGSIDSEQLVPTLLAALGPERPAASDPFNGPFATLNSRPLVIVVNSDTHSLREDPSRWPDEDWAELNQDSSGPYPSWSGAGNFTNENTAVETVIGLELAHAAALLDPDATESIASI